MNKSFFRELEPATCGAFADAFSGSNSLVPASPAFPASSALLIILEDSNLRYPWSDRFSRPLYFLRMPVMADRVQKLASRVFRIPLYYYASRLKCVKKLRTLFEVTLFSLARGPTGPLPDSRGWI